MKFPILILLAGGTSSRFAPLKEKMLTKFIGRTVVERQLEQYKEAGFDKIIIVASDNNHSLIENEAKRIKSNAKVLIQSGEGMAGAVNTALKEIEDHEDVLITNMIDILDDSIFTKFKNFLSKNKNSNAIAGYYTEKYFNGGYIVLEGDTVKSVIEKPGEGNEPSKYVKLVFDYFTDSKNLKEALKKASSSKDDVYEVALSRLMKSGQKFKLIKHDGDWLTIKYPWHVLSMMEYFLSKIGGQEISTKAEIAKSAIISGQVIIEEGVKIFENAVIRGPVYIGRNSIVANNALVRESHIGDDCVVGYSTEIARSYISDRCWFHTNYIGDSVLGSNVSLGSGAVVANLRLDEQEIKMNIKGERIDTGLTKLGNVIGEGARIGVNSSILPGIKIGRNSFIGSNVLVDEDVEDNQFIYIKQEKVIRENKFDSSKINRDKIKKNLSK